MGYGRDAQNLWIGNNSTWCRGTRDCGCSRTRTVSLLFWGWEVSGKDVNCWQYIVGSFPSRAWIFVADLGLDPKARSQGPAEKLRHKVEGTCVLCEDALLFLTLFFWSILLEGSSQCLDDDVTVGKLSLCQIITWCPSLLSPEPNLSWRKSLANICLWVAESL